jgi:hypothetical protein
LLAYIWKVLLRIFFSFLLAVSQTDVSLDVYCWTKESSSRQPVGHLRENWNNWNRQMRISLTYRALKTVFFGDSCDCDSFCWLSDGYHSYWRHLYWYWPSECELYQTSYMEFCFDFPCFHLLSVHPKIFVSNFCFLENI